MLIVGAGAIGSSVASIIEDSGEGTVAVLADEDRAAAYERTGFIVNGKQYRFPCIRPAERSTPDLIIVAVKNNSLEDAIAFMRNHVGGRTTIISLMNGITSEERLAAEFGWERVLYAMIVGIDAVREGNATSFSSPGTIFFGETKNAENSYSKRVLNVAEFLSSSGLSYVIPEDMLKALWYKFMINVGINQVSAVLRAPYRVFQSVAEARHVMEAAMREVIALANLEGVPLSESDIEIWYKTLARLGPEGKTSMLQDVEAKRKTEVELFSGTVKERAARYGLPVPVNDILYSLIRTIEQDFV